MDKNSNVNMGDPSSLVLTIEEIRKIERGLNTKFAAVLKKRFFQLKTTAGDATAEVSIALQDDTKSFFYPVEARIMHKEQNVSKKESVMFLIDYIDTYFDEFFRDGENTYLPIDWMAYSCEGIDFQIKGQIINARLDSMADRLLGGELLGDNEINAYRSSHRQ